jgi:anti-sigma B factor antagonist
MNLQVDSSGDVKILRIQEERLVYTKLPDFLAEVNGLVDSGVRKLILDFSAVRYVDSASIGCLMNIYRLLSDQAGVVKLVGLQDRVETMVGMTGLQNLIEVYREEKAALASF